MNYKNVSQEILEKVGGRENVKNVSHCYTRLRFNLVNDSKADGQGIEAIDGVLNVMIASGQFQVVIGTEVDKVYEEFMKLMGESHESVHEVKKKKTVKEMINGVLDIFIECFTPIIPVIAGCGMIKVLCAVLLNFGLLSDQSSTYQILSIIGDSVFYFLPLFVGYTAAKKMNADPFIGMVLSAILLHPNFIALGAEGDEYSSFLSIPVKLMSYSAQALPVILSVWLMKYVDKFTQKICPSLVKVFLRPMLTLLIVAPIMLIVIGPLGGILGDYFQGFCNVMNSWGWVAVGLNAAIFPLLVLTGMHNALIPLMIQMFATQGFDAVLVPSGLIANIAEGGAAAAVALKSKNKNIKGTAMSACVSSLFGVTEPALYGINLRFKKPFIAVLLGSLIAGCFAGLMGITAYSFVSPSIVSLPIFAGEGSSFIWAIVSVVVSFVVTFIIAWVLGFDDVKNEDLKSVDAPMSGDVIALSEVQDAAFASEQMGKGYAIIPTDGKVVAPFDGEIVALFPTKHAIGIKRIDGLELLIHIGLDTVNLNGEGFKSYVAVGTHVKAGDLLIEFDLDGMKKKGYDLTTPVIVTNSDQYKNVSFQNKKTIQMNEVILNVE
ncbi:beta-glucoside-specific PTS transporter subunit IIABC [Candidatus Stoquefichus massiliensis]|uniref:beta-glucoside-specific PTS transporter subunit IIABC n=1 Tax=Candidatus Stoquefichus massiliensis TaxID=1470350 RepID=UPI0004802EA9|nr:beta-glucoside-specific PTS transporter subunit IIABC [Candidatus Stoquefichus massiliensis]